MPSSTKTTPRLAQTLLYLGLVEKANNRRDYRWTTLGTYANRNTATTIKWMVEHGKGIKAFESAQPGTYEGRIIDQSTVQFRKVKG